MPDLSPQVGVVSASSTAGAQRPFPPTITARPFVRLTISASIVPGDPTDTARYYRFVAGVPLGDGGSVDAAASSSISYQDGDSLRTVTGSCGLLSLSGQDSLSGQSCNIRLAPVGTADLLARRIRTKDRIRIEIIHPPIKGLTTSPCWLAFDGLVRSVRGMVAGSGGTFRSTLSIIGGGLQTLLAGAVYNWQNQIHPDAKVMAKFSDTVLGDHLGKVAAPPHEIISAFLRGAVGTAMSLRVGDDVTAEGLPIMDYLRFGQGQDWSSVKFTGSSLCYPIPWNLLQQASSSSCWALVQMVAEACWHEVFVGYRDFGGRTLPALIHRPRPYPGLAEFDANWKALPVRRIGTWPGPGVIDLSDELSDGAFPNTFHWAGLSLGDQSRDLEFMKIALGFVVSDRMVNRFGYSAVGLTTKLAPISQGSSAADMTKFARTGLLHYATQDVGLPYMKRQSFGGVFLPVRPGEVLECDVMGDSPDALTTGYITATSFGLSSSNGDFSLSMTAEVDRVLYGVDAAGYPARVRALVPDLRSVAYAGEGLGHNRPAPNQETPYEPPKAKKGTSRPSMPVDLVGPIHAASRAFGIPSWVIAHVLHNETGLGTNLGTPIARRNGIAQITGVATSALIQAGHTNPDGTAFRARDKGDRARCVHACGAFLKIIKNDLTDRGLPSSAQSYWSWVIRGYRWGAASTADLGTATGWRWPSAGEAFPDYRRYWSPQGVAKGKQNWGYLG